MAIIPKIITLLKTGEQRILERFDGRVRLGIFLLLVFSYGLILFTWSLSFPCMFDMRLSIRASIPFRFVFDASSLTAAFLFLWGVTQAMIMFYMEHRKERILGVTLDRIIFTSMGRELVKATLILFIVEMLFWITAVLTDNHYLMISNLILQLINIVALFSIIYNKQKPRSVIGTCVWETKHERRLWMSRDKKDDKTKEIPKLLAFELMKEENVPTSVSFNEIKDVIRWIYKASDDEDPKLRFEYELNMTERICEIYKEKNGIPRLIRFIFEGEGLADEKSQRVILYHLISAGSSYKAEDIIKMLSSMGTKNERHYTWCGIWSEYWQLYSKDYDREKDINDFMRMADNANIPLIDFMNTGAEDFKLSEAYYNWKERCNG